MILETKDKRDEILYTRPSSIYDETELKKEYGSVASWYAQNVRWISSHYNTVTSGLPSTIPDAPKTGDSTSLHGRHRQGPVDEIIENIRYFLGDQEVASRYYMTQDHKGGQLPAPWVNGQQIFRLIEVVNNGVRNLLSASKVSVQSLNPSKISKKMEYLRALTLKRDFKEMFDSLEADFGVGFYPEQGGAGGGDVDIEELIERAEESPSDEMEESGLDILDDFISKNNLNSKLLLGNKLCLAGRYFATWITQRNGRLYAQVIPPYNLILDMSKDDDFNMEAEFIGVIEFLTPEEISQRWGLTADERALLKEMVSMDTAGVDFSNRLNNSFSGLGFNWIGPAPAGGPRHIACVTAYWEAEDHEKREENDNPLRVVDDEDEETDVFLGMHRATIIGNAILKGYGREDNVVYHPNLTYKPMFPVRAYIPGMIAGTVKSPVDRMKDIQADIDTYRFKIRDAVSKHIGKAVILNAAKLGLPDSTVQTIAGDLKSLGFTVVPGADGENPSIMDNKPAAEYIDLSTHDDILAWIQLIRFEDEFMKSVINASEISLGQQRSYIGLATQQQTVERNEMGTAAYTSGFMQYYASLCHYALNYAKIMFMDNKGAEEVQTILSARGISFFKNTTEFQLEDFMIKVDIEDIIDAQGKQRLMDIALAMAQNSQHTGFDWEDYLLIESSRTYSELRRKMIRRIRRRKAEAQEAAMQSEMMAQAEREAARQFQTEQQDKAEQGRNSREMLKTEADLVKEGFRAGQKQQDNYEQPM